MPGAEAVEMVYNDRDLLVLSRDGRQRAAGEWSFTKYDGLNREVLTGIYKDSRDREAMETAAKADEVMVESRAVNDQHLGYSNQAFPDASPGGGTYYLTAGYYDDHDFNNDGDADYAYEAAGISGYDEPVEYPYNKGRQTGSKVLFKDGGTEEWLTTAVFYDDRGREIQQQSDNHLEGRDIFTTVYKNVVSNRVEATRHLHTREGFPTLTIDRMFSYDHADRLLVFELIQKGLMNTEKLNFCNNT